MTPHLVGFGEIGAYLREMRESLGVEAAQAARAMHLKPAYLHALEAGKLEALPGFTYARGYLATYVEYLGLDRALLMRAFDEAASFRPRPVYQPEPTRRDARPGWALLLGVALLLLALATWRSLFSPSEGSLPAASPSEEKISIAAPAQPVSSAPPVENPPCLRIMPIGESAFFCRNPARPLQILGMQPRLRYSSELQFPNGMQPKY